MIHPVFHISQLKPFHPNYTPIYAELPKVKDLSVMNTVPEAILERRLVKKGYVAVPQVKVKWSICRSTQRHGKTTMCFWCDFLMLLLEVKQVLPPGEMLRILHDCVL